MFNLEQAIVEWRRQMLAAGIKTPVPLEELEIHLREDIEQQIKSGLNEQEAFNFAVYKIGQPRLLKTEFKKAGGIGAFMKIYRILGILWMLFNGVLGILYLWLLLHPIIRFSRVPSSPWYYLGALSCLLYWAGAVAGFSLFRGAQGARKFVTLVAFLIVMATIAGFVALRSLPGMYYIASVFALVSVVVLLLERITKRLERKHTDAA